MKIPTMKKVYLLLLLCYFGLHSSAQIATTYTSGTTWTVPTGVTSITVKVYGGGGGLGGQDCGAGCGYPAASAVGYVQATYSVVATDIIGIYPGGRGADGLSAVTSRGGGAGGISPFSANYNGGNGGNTGPSGNSGAGGGGGAASVLTINSAIRIVAGGAGGGGGMANAANSGQAGVSTISANGTLNRGGNGGYITSGDGGGAGGGGGGQYGSLGGVVYSVGSESAGRGGHRGNNSVAGTPSAVTNTTAVLTAAGQIEITYTAVAGTASSSQSICPGTAPSNIILSGYAGTIQWQRSTDNVTWSDINGATLATLTSAQTGTLITTTYYRARVSNSLNSNVVTATVLPASVAASMPTGSGTVGAPYLINSFAHLRWISENSASWDKVFSQTANIDAANSNTSCYNAGAGWSPIGNSVTSFTGVYNGNGNTISNLFLKRSGVSDLGFFGRNAGTIQNLNVTAANISVTAPPAFTNIGVLVGFNAGSVSGCRVAGTVSGGDHYNGGIAGQSTGSITNSSSSANVSGSNYTGGIAGQAGGTINRVFSTGTITGGGLTGGIVGCMRSGSLNDSYSHGTITGSYYTGGAVGNIIDGTVTNVYSTGTVTAATSSGGCIGEVTGTGKSVNCFWDMESSGRPSSGGGAIGKTTAEMKSYGTFFNATWDLQCEPINGTNNHWGINSTANNGYPFLSWQGFTTQCPVWSGQNNSTLNDASNWTNGFVPLPGMDIIMSPSAQHDLNIGQNWQTGNITFNNSGRKINIGNNDFTIGGSINGADAANYIRTSGAGSVKINISNGASFTVPVGNSSYNPVTITNRNGSADVFSVSVVDEVYKNGTGGAVITPNHVRRTWNINKTTPNTGGGVDLAFNWNVADLTSPIATSALYNFEGGNWRAISGTPAITAGSLTFTGYTGMLSPFAIADISLTLPMTWVSFTATRQLPGVMLDWTTANEVNVITYEIEHSMNGNTWSRIGTVAAAGSQAAHHYSYAHAKPSDGVNFYRILQRDADGRFTYSKVASVNIDVQKKLQIYPNPVTGKTLNVMAVEQGNVRIVNSAGGTVMQIIVQKGNNQVNTGSLTKGMYVLIAGNERISFVVQ